MILIPQWQYFLYIGVFIFIFNIQTKLKKISKNMKILSKIKRNKVKIKIIINNSKIIYSSSSSSSSPNSSSILASISSTF